MVLLARLPALFQVVRQIEHLEQLLRAPVGNPGERATLEAVGDRDHGCSILLMDRLDND